MKTWIPFYRWRSSTISIAQIESHFDFWKSICKSPRVQSWYEFTSLYSIQLWLLNYLKNTTYYKICCFAKLDESNQFYFRISLSNFRKSKWDSLSGTEGVLHFPSNLWTMINLVLDRKHKSVGKYCLQINIPHCQNKWCIIVSYY